MIEQNDQAEKREKNAFDTGKALDVVDSFPDMQEWFKEDVVAMEQGWPRIVGKLPCLVTTASAPKTKRRRYGKIIARLVALLLAFGLGAFTVSLQNADQFVTEETVAPTNLDDSFDYSSAWPDLETLTNDANAVLAEYSFKAASEPSSLQSLNNVFSSLDSIELDEREFQQNVGVMPDENDNVPQTFLASQEEFDASRSVMRPSVATDVSDPIKTSAQSSLFVSSNDNLTPASPMTGGFADYSFESSSSPRYDEDVETSNPTQTAERERDHFLSNVAPQTNSHNEDFEHSDYQNQIRQNNSINSRDIIAFSNAPDYNNQEDYSKNASRQASERLALTPTASNVQDSVQNQSRFQGFGSLSRVASTSSDVPVDSSFPNDDLDAEYVAQNFEAQAVEARVQTQKPTRAVRW